METIEHEKKLVGSIQPEIIHLQTDLIPRTQAICEAQCTGVDNEITKLNGEIDRLTDLKAEFIRRRDDDIASFNSRLAELQILADLNKGRADEDPCLIPA